MNTQTTTLEPITIASPSQTQPAINIVSTPSTTPTPEPATTSKVRRPHRLWGAIQNLPTRTRQWLNQSLRDGVPYKHIIASLEKKGRHISKQQLSKWVKSGYANWLAEQQFIETRKLHAEALAANHNRADKSTHANLREYSGLDMSIHLHDASRLINMDDLRNLFATKPENFFRLVRAHVAHERNALMRDRFQFEVQKHAAKEKKQKRAAAPKKIPTRMDIERYKRDLNIVPAEYQPIEYGGKATFGVPPSPAAATTTHPTTATAPSQPSSRAARALTSVHPTTPAPTPLAAPEEIIDVDPSDPAVADRLHFEI